VLHDVGAGAGLRYTCHCDNCQAYAHHLGRAGIRDDRGGTDAFQTNASRLEIARGLDKLASLRVANQPMRPAIHWYAACCATPLFDVATGKPISRPRQMTPDERAAAAARIAAWKAAREAATV
jgi:hypothetical protein